MTSSMSAPGFRPYPGQRGIGAVGDGLHPEVVGNGQQKKHGAYGYQGPGRELSQGQQDEGGKGVDHQHVAVPQLNVQQANSKQQNVAPEVQPNSQPAASVCAFDEEHDPGAEQQGEEPHELLIDEDFAEDAYGPVQPGLGASGAEVPVGHMPELEADGVHQEYAQHGDTANEVKAGYPGGFRHRAGVGLASFNGHGSFLGLLPDVHKPVGFFGLLRLIAWKGEAASGNTAHAVSGAPAPLPRAEE